MDAGSRIPPRRESVTENLCTIHTYAEAITSKSQLTALLMALNWSGWLVTKETTAFPTEVDWLKLDKQNTKLFF